jgi:hypothetical protein
MRTDRSGVAGFFEDLPVLMFVLSGVVALVLTSVFVSERMTSDKMNEQLDSIASRIADSVASEIRFSRGPDMLPSVSSIRAFNCSDEVSQLSDGRCFVLSVFSLHPSLGCLLNICSDQSRPPRSTGYASELLNALCDDGLSMVLEVMVVVW